MAVGGNGEGDVGLQAVEILHIDTAGSQRFFGSFDANPSEKCDCQRILFDLFSVCCQRAGGYVAANWQGDGGHAFFPAKQKSGNSIQAARDFLSKLPILAQQTATTLGRGIKAHLARRRFRIKAHFGLVRLTAESKFDSAFPGDFDSFLKHERELAPVPDELFITDQLRSQLGGAEKLLFQQYKEPAIYGSLKTGLYRLVSKPTNHARKIFEEGERPQNITDSEWQFLRSHILSQRMNTVARNSITLGLIKGISGNEGLSHHLLTHLTLRALYNYLRAVYSHYSFNLTLWRPLALDGVMGLEQVMVYPAGELPDVRRVTLGEVQYQVVRAFNSCSPVVTQCVSESRLEGEWVDFAGPQMEPSGGLQSAVQLPIYRTKNEIGDYVEKEPLAVLSVDSDKPDLFLKEEMDLWTQDFIGFLANLALAEHMRRAEVVQLPA